MNVESAEVDSGFEVETSETGTRHYKRKKHEAKQRRMANLKKAREARKVFFYCSRIRKEKDTCDIFMTVYREIFFL